MTTPLEQLMTEQVDEQYNSIDTASVAELAGIMNEADATVPAAVNAALGQIVPAVEGVVARLKAGGRLFYVGAGTAGRLGVLDASECPPTFNTAPGQVYGILAGGMEALVAAQEGAEDDEQAGAADVISHGVGSGDAVVGIASSGRTPYVLGALRAARDLGALTIALACNADSDIGLAADLPIEVLVGPEVVAGSTRLKAGTAQKMVLNMISTISMVQLGKTYGNLMVDMRATNEKLRERAIRMVRLVTDAGRDEALAALHAADMEVKPAILLIRSGVDVPEARARLQRAEGRLRLALEE
ncbi:N-acetylmuramic acid 6-phosphate etherase [Phytoactinopolyspora mesophila]|uniref:N-acetylmuramic acid 6-phosphate etherase n=1 Tax=Phytoactinopolyspora mesophila TaxID=2650750 RepID=A0A7K3LZ21_9ACTN|nr:N-acetylmuramic acid 6-phosphate etherase [Phytoactinopolyspora mesophila]NDL55942.1 N-acetylmuramic acid 6-phosphate etherase [Phytoactinopolyspora mesophila]